MSKVSERIANLTPEQRALLEKRMRATAPRPQASQPIAILGMGCRLPGGVEDPDAYWRLLMDGVDAITEVPADRWDNARLHDPDPESAGRISSRWGGFVRDVDRFDAAYFGISPREAVRMDPQQRLLLEVAVDALEDAGIATDRLGGSDTGVFVGAHGHASDYLWLQYTDPTSIDAFTGTGTAHNLFAGRLSYIFDLHGPSIVVDTACSSSLVAVHLAVQSLRSGESSLALAAGVNLILGPHFSIAASRMHMLAPDGRCKAFDQRADGFVRSEGCGVVVLKRLADALADGDPIRAVIRGSAMNQDGHTNGITAPNGLAQRAVIERALRDAGVEGGAIGYVEAHGTGTSLGDPIEVEALAATVGRGGTDVSPCWVGSVKTNIGHLEGAAGVAGLIKAVLVLQHREIPRNLHFTGLNPHIATAGTRIVFPAQQQSWSDAPRGRLAAVSSFGWSGTNTHIVLEEAPAKAAIAAAAGSAAQASILPLSARSPAALRELMHRHRARITTAAPGEVQGLCCTAALRRTHHDHRVALVAADRDGFIAAIDGTMAGSSPRRSVERRRTVFVFPGQGSQWLGMGRGLLQSEPEFRKALERCDAAIRTEAGWSLLEELHGDQASTDIGVLQPTLFAVQVALAALWRSWGIEPEAVVGHSMGEVAAAHVAGILDLAAATRVICRRSALLRRVAGRGAMALVELPLAEAREACGTHVDRIAVAVSNGPRASVLSGDPQALDEVVARLGARGVFCRLVKVDVASHSPQVDELREDLLSALAGMETREGDIPFYSTVSAEVRRGGELGPDYWVRNLRDPVRFYDAVRLLLAAQFDAFVEISPHPILVPPVEDAIAEAGADALGIASLRRDQPERTELLQGLARLYERGAQVDWTRLWPERAPVTVLPTYPWQRERYWLDDLKPSGDFSWRSGSASVPGDVNEDTRRWLFVPEWRRREAVVRAPALEAGAWLVFADSTGRGAEIAARLAGAGRDAWTVVPGDAFAATGARSFSLRPGERDDYDKLLAAMMHSGVRVAGVVHCWNVDAPANDADVEALQEFQVAGCASVCFLIQALVAHDLARPPRIKIVTQGAQSPDGRSTTLAQTPVWGLGRVIAEEHPEFWGGLVDLDPRASGAAAAEFVVRELGTDDVEDGIAQSGGERYVLAPGPLPREPSGAWVQRHPRPRHRCSSEPRVRATRRSRERDIVCLDNGMYKLWFARHFRCHQPGRHTGPTARLRRGAARTPAEPLVLVLLPRDDLHHVHARSSHTPTEADGRTRPARRTEALVLAPQSSPPTDGPSALPSRLPPRSS